MLLANRHPIQEQNKEETVNKQTSSGQISQLKSKMDKVHLVGLRAYRMRPSPACCSQTATLYKSKKKPVPKPFGRESSKSERHRSPEYAFGRESSKTRKTQTETHDITKETVIWQGHVHQDPEKKTNAKSMVNLQKHRTDDIWKITLAFPLLPSIILACLGKCAFHAVTLNTPDDN